MTVDVSSRLAPRHSTVLRLLIRMLLGSMQFNAILLDSSSSSSSVSQFPASSGPTSEKALKAQSDNEKGRFESKSEQLKLWGLSLGMTLDLIAYMHPSSAPFAADYPRDEVTGLGTSIAPSMT